jgi:hypothetical protein
MNNRKLFFGIVTLALLSSSFVFAQEIATTKNVTFTVTIGKLLCKEGVGSSMVKFENTPEEGGYYEVMGKKIDENKISLTRNVSLPSGTYFWNGIPQNGYATTTASSGTFTIKECAKETAVTATQTMAGKDKPLVTPTENTSTVKTETKATGTPVSIPKEKTTSFGNTPLIIFIFVIVAGFIINKYGSMRLTTEETSDKKDSEEIKK